MTPGVTHFGSCEPMCGGNEENVPDIPSPSATGFLFGGKVQQKLEVTKERNRKKKENK